MFIAPEGATALDCVLAEWPDGFRAPVAKITCHDKWPQQYPLASGRVGCMLPPRAGKKGGKKSDVIWEGERKGERVHLIWRSCRGWQLSLYHGSSNQICQLKIAGLVSTDDSTVPEQAIALMKKLGMKYAGEEVACADLFTERDTLLPEFKLDFAYGKKKKATAKEAAKPKEAATPKEAVLAKASSQKRDVDARDRGACVEENLESEVPVDNAVVAAKKKKQRIFGRVNLHRQPHLQRQF